MARLLERLSVRKIFFLRILVSIYGRKCLTVCFMINNFVSRFSLVTLVFPSLWLIVSKAIRCLIESEWNSFIASWGSTSAFAFASALEFMLALKMIFFDKNNFFSHYKRLTADCLQASMESFNFHEKLN